MVAADIISAITVMVGSSHKEWKIGVTNELVDHDEFRERHPRWNSWQAASLGDAHAVESHFLGHGMEHASGGEVSNHKAVYVYVF